MRPTDVGGAMDGRDDDRERIRRGQAQYLKVTGEVECDQPGEGVINVLFPVYFTEKPRFSYGLELLPGQALVAGQFPRCSATVMRWGQRGRDDGSFVYSGAALSISTEGPTGQVLVVQWHMEGMALSGPVPTS